MAPGPIPTPVPALSSGIIHFQEYVEHYLDSGLSWLGGFDAPNPSWQRVSFQYRYTGATDVHDDMYIGMDIANITGGALDSSWTTADYTTMEGFLDTLATAIAALQNTNVKLIAYKWYEREFNPYTLDKPFAPTGAPKRVTTKSVAGTLSAGPLASQSAFSITFKNPFPRNWGRVYIPGLDGTDDTAAGFPPRFASAKVDAIATAFIAFINSMAAAQFQLVTAITSLGTGPRGSAGGGSPNRRLAQVTSIQVDDIPDVIRRRRPHQSTHVKVLP